MNVKIVLYFLVVDFEELQSDLWNFADRQLVSVSCFLMTPPLSLFFGTFPKLFALMCTFFFALFQLESAASGGEFFHQLLILRQLSSLPLSHFIGRRGSLREVKLGFLPAAYTAVSIKEPLKRRPSKLY